ncbi:two-component sensor histidine kinase, partial [Streptomyces scabiei]|nr:two-component sensor histidine kinase [Streptomyces scabiei]
MSGRRRTRTRSWPRLRRGRGRQPRTLRTRLVVSAVALIAVVASVIGTVTTFALSEHLYDQLAANVQDIAKRTDGPRGPGPVGALGDVLDVGRQLVVQMLT